MWWLAPVILLVVPMLGLLALRLFQPPPRVLGLDQSGRFADLGPKSNWVSSDSADPAHRIAPLPASSHSAFELLVANAEGLPGARVVDRDEHYVHLEVRSRLFRFVDDLELHYRSERHVAAVRSAARAGSRDLGVNRRRVERLRRTVTDP